MHIVADIGGTNLRVAAVSGDSLGEIKKVPTPKTPVEGIAAFVALARGCAQGQEITAVTGCVAGRVSDEGVISGARNLSAWEGMNIAKELSEALSAPVHIVNDAALAGVGEAYAGAGKTSKRFAYVTVSTGVGGGLIVSGKVAAAGGVGRIQIRGANLEDLISGTAVTKKFGIHPKDLDSLEERNKLADTLAEGLRILVEQWKPETIVLGGSMIVGVNPIPISRVQGSLNKLLPNAPVIKMAELGDNGGLWGALALLKKV